MIQRNPERTEARANISQLRSEANMSWLDGMQLELGRGILENAYVPPDIRKWPTTATINALITL